MGVECATSVATFNIGAMAVVIEIVVGDDIFLLEGSEIDVEEGIGAVMGDATCGPLVLSLGAAAGFIFGILVAVAPVVGLH